jgi:hypothetical protein
LIVTPHDSVSDVDDDRAAAIKGAAVILWYSYGGTSGRWSVAAGIARFFPDHREFIQSIKDMGLEVGDLPSSRDQADVIRRRTNEFVRYTTLPKRKGWGTRWLLAPSNDPVDGIAKLILDPDGPDLIDMQVRLPHEYRNLAPVILASAATDAPK